MDGGGAAVGRAKRAFLLPFPPEIPALQGSSHMPDDAYASSWNRFWASCATTSHACCTRASELAHVQKILQYSVVDGGSYEQESLLKLD